MSIPFLEVFDDPGDLSERAAALFTESALEAVEKQGVFRVALAGGSTPLFAYRLLAEEPWVSVVPWKKTHIFFGDERCVPESHVIRNDLAAREALLSIAPIPPGNIHPIEADKPGAELKYEKVIREVFQLPHGVPRFDLILLGIGADGHTASLFARVPGKERDESGGDLVLLVTDSPKPPARRITLSLAVFNAAHRAVFMATGPEKREAVTRAVAGDPAIPAGRVRPVSGSLVFLLDRPAAEEIAREVTR